MPVLLESCHTDSDCGINPRRKVQAQAQIVQWLPAVFWNLNINRNTTLLFRESQPCDRFWPELLKRPIYTQNDAELIYCVAMGACHMA